MYFIERKLVAAAAVPALALAVPALAEPVSTTAEARAEIDNSVLLVRDQDLEFGKIATGSAGGTVTINAATDTATKVGTVALYGPNRHRAEFTVKGVVGQVMVLSVEPSVTLTRAGGTETMTATLTRANGTGLVTATVAVGIPGSPTVILMPIGEKLTLTEAPVYVGGSLTVAPGQAEGAYKGEFELTATFL